MRRYILTTLLSSIIILSLPLAVVGQTDGPPDRLVNRELPQALADLKLSTPIEISGIDPAVLDQSLSGTGLQRVIIRLSADSVADAKVNGRTTAPGQVKKQAEAQQNGFLNRVLAAYPSARVIAKVQVVMNAVFVEVDASVLPTLAADQAVVRIAPVGDYELSLDETVPYIGAAAVQAQGYDGTGIRVAVLDSGIDYLHANLGGSGDPVEFAANDPLIIEPGTFPTAKVVGGYDFVGDLWDRGLDVIPDPDPLDAGAGGGHGTHVADIIGGMDGVAPGVDLYAVKVCSSLSTACSGVGLIAGMEFAVDPDGDGNPMDHVDIINMSLGSDYGQTFDDDLVLAVDNATALGVLTVAASGNGGDKPYITGTPASADTALSVAQTAVPSAGLPMMGVTAPAAIAGNYPAIWQSWSAPLTGVIDGPLQYGDGAGGNLDGCAPFAPDSLAGMIVLVDRGECNFTLKIKNIGDAGGSAGIIGLVALGDPFNGGDGGDRPIDIPGYMVDQVISTMLKNGLPDTYVSFDPGNTIPLVGSMVGSSSRGPRNPDSYVKPEIGAPGASVSAIAGSGTDTGPFGGTSGATPMVTGSAALLLQADSELSPAEVRARLVNNGETDILNDVLSENLAPISRIGGGEVRVDLALDAPAAAWDDHSGAAVLNFGFVDVDKETVNLLRKVRVRNYSNRSFVYQVTPTFRFENDALNGAVTVKAPRFIWVRAGKDTTFVVKMTIKGEELWTNYMNSGSMGADPSGLTHNEYDGYLVFEGKDHDIHLPWHVLPNKASYVIGRKNLTFEQGMDVIKLTNVGVGTAQNDAYALLATSPNKAEGELGGQAPMPDIRAVGINTFPVPADFCSTQDSFVWAFAINTWERQSHLLPVVHEIMLDTNQDGVADYSVLNSDASGPYGLGDGRQLTWAIDWAAMTASAIFYAEHATNTGNTVLWICGEQVGLTGTDMLATNVDIAVYTQDVYFGGPGDMVDGLTVTPLGEQYFGLPDDIPGKSGGVMTVIDFDTWPGNTPELGVMLLTNGDRGHGHRGGSDRLAEVLLFKAP